MSVMISQPTGERTDDAQRSLERRAFEKVAWRVLPILILTYIFNYLDRTNVGIAALTMNKDVGLPASQVGAGAGIPFVGYCLFEVPSNLVLYRVGARLWIARRFAAEGANVALTYVGNAEAAGRVVSAIEGLGRKAVAIKADASDPATSGPTVEQATDRFGPLDIIVHSAGVSEFIGLTEASATDYGDAYRRHFAINVGGVVALTAAALPQMRDNDRVIIGSVNAHQVPFPGTAVYGASKAAAAALARGWARDLGPRGILTNVIQPGPIEMEMNRTTSGRPLK